MPAPRKPQPKDYSARADRNERLWIGFDPEWAADRLLWAAGQPIPEPYPEVRSGGWAVLDRIPPRDFATCSPIIPAKAGIQRCA